MAWAGGQVTDESGTVVAQVSYNGRVWPPGEWTPRHGATVGGAAMTTPHTNQNSPRRKQERFVRWAIPPGVFGIEGVLVLTVDGEATAYLARRIPADAGEGWELMKFRKAEGDERIVYHVCLAIRHGQHSCECKGFLRWGHCKHVEALLALAAKEGGSGCECPDA
jgi:hypothetical protein